MQSFNVYIDTGLGKFVRIDTRTATDAAAALRTGFTNHREVTANDVMQPGEYCLDTTDENVTTATTYFGAAFKAVAAEIDSTPEPPKEIRRNRRFRGNIGAARLAKTAQPSAHI